MRGRLMKCLFEDNNRKKQTLYNLQMGCGAVNSHEIDNRPQQTVLTLNRIYQRKELIGSGTYGKVYRCINKLNGQEYALKVVEITAKTKEQALKQINNLKAEIGVLKKINNQNIVKYYSFDISEDSKQVQIVLQYAKRGSLKEYIQERGSLNQKQASAMAMQILKGLKYLHDQNIVHRDLKCANILVMEDGTLKISDFGTAKSIKITNNQDIAKLCSSLKGTPYYMAPQILRRTGHGISADIWSLGCLVIEMVSGRAPWTSLTSKFQEIISYIVSGIHPPFPKGLTEECKCFLQSCLDNVPSQRLTAQELLKHRWIDHKSLEKLKVLEQKQTNRGLSSMNTKQDFLEQEYLQKQLKPQKRKVRQQKYREIDNYLNQRANVSFTKRKQSAQKNSNKNKKDRSASIKITDSNLNLVEEEDIQVTPHIQPQPRQQARQQNSKKGKQSTFKRDDMMKVTKTTPQMKLPQNIIHQMKEIQQQSIVFPVNSNIQTEMSDQPRLRTEASKEDVIDTLISRQQRLKYLQMQKQIREQRQQQKRKWQLQLKQGANYLRKEITNRYL